MTIKQQITSDCYICPECGLQLYQAADYDKHITDKHTTERDGYALYSSEDVSDLTGRIIWPMIMEGTLEECLSAWENMVDVSPEDEKYIIRRIRIIECEVVETNIDPQED